MRQSWYLLVAVLAFYPLAAQADRNPLQQLLNISSDIFHKDPANNNSEDEAQLKNLLLQQDLAKKEIIKLRENNRIWSIASICFISLVSLMMVITALHKLGGTASDIVSASGLNFIVFGTIILVTISDTEQQLTAAMGVLGAIAGYLFGTIKDKITHQNSGIYNDE